MKILWISQNLPYPPKTGVLQRNYHLIREASAFADVHLVAILKRDILPDFDAELAQRELKKLCSQVDVVELPTETSRLRFYWTLFKSLFTSAAFTINWAHSPRLRQLLADALGTHDFALVYFDTISLVTYRPLADNVATVLNHHNIESHLLDRRINYERNPLRRLYYRLEARKLRNAEASLTAEYGTNMTVSALDAERLRELCPAAKTTVVPNGVDTEYFKSGSTEPEPGHLIMVSGMNWFPNRDAVLFMTREIWPVLSTQLPNVRLTIVGASPPPEVTQLAARDSRVAVTGFVDDVRPYMDKAQIYLCPMRDGGGTRLKILDALSMGKPIVATRMALEGIDVASEQEVLTAETPQEFVSQIRRIIDDSALRTELSVKGREFVERNFSWAAIGQGMQRTFEGLTNRGRQK